MRRGATVVRYQRPRLPLIPKQPILLSASYKCQPNMELAPWNVV